MTTTNLGEQLYNLYRQTPYGRSWPTWENTAIHHREAWAQIGDYVREVARAQDDILARIAELVDKREDETIEAAVARVVDERDARFVTSDVKASSPDPEAWERRAAVWAADARDLKRDRADLNVLVPALILRPSPREFLESMARNAEVNGRACGGDYRGVAIYTTLRGRLHRVIVEDLEPSLRVRGLDPEPK